MTITSRERRTWLLPILVLIVLGWFAMPYASQESANEGFILFSTDRDNPDTHETCPACEEIYMMPADAGGRPAPGRRASPTTTPTTRPRSGHKAEADRVSFQPK